MNWFIDAVEKEIIWKYLICEWNIGLPIALEPKFHFFYQIWVCNNEYSLLEDEFRHDDVK